MALLPKRQYLRDDSTFVFLTPNDLIQALLPTSGPGSYPTPTGPSFIRNLFTAATTFYVNADTGSDINDGSIGAPWKTLAAAMLYLTSLFDFGGQAVTLQCVAGHASFTAGITISPWVGGGSFTFDLGGGSITTTNADAVSITGQPPGVPTVQNGTLSTVTSGNCLHQQSAGVVQFQSLTFGACANAHILVNGGGGRLNCIGNYTISGNANRHVQVNPTNAVSIEQLAVPGLTVTLIGTPAFAFAFAVIIGGVAFIDGTTLFSGSATGARYFINSNGFINTQGAGTNYLPGNAAGTPATPSAPQAFYS